MKKIIALVLALAMTMLCIATLAEAPNATNPLAHDGTLTVSGLETGDTVAYYKVLEWNKDDPDGWVFTNDFTSAGNSVRQAILTTGISGEIAATLQPLARTPVTSPAGSVSGTTWTAGSTSAPVDAGLYMVIITPATPGMIYNPVFVASNFKRGEEDASTNNSISLTTNALSYSDNAMAKKSQITLEKTASGDADSTNPLNDTNPNTTDVGEVLDFTVVTMMPKYGENYTNPVFKVQDTLTGLTLDTNSLVVKVGAAGSETTLTDGTQYEATKSANGYTVTFKKDYIQSNNIPAAGLRIVITYKAEVSDTAQFMVNQDENTVDVIFSTNPSDQTGAGRLRDKTNHFTFSIDGKIFGNDEEKSHEVVKVGKDSAGNIIEEEQNYYYGTKHAALEGAVFGLYKDANCTNLYTNDVFQGYVTSDGMGLLTINGLDQGIYYLKEIEAPEGYIKVQDPVKVTITADISTDTSVTEVIDPDGINATVTYITNKLNSYSITFGEGNNAVSTNYEITNDGKAAIETVTRLATSADKELENIKGVELPSTGGIGTTIFYILGGLLVVGAAVILVARRKAHD